MTDAAPNAQETKPSKVITAPILALVTLMLYTVSELSEFRTAVFPLAVPRASALRVQVSSLE